MASKRRRFLQPLKLAGLLTLFRRKVYKDKINKWGWKKNIPGHYAQWMVRKANQRKKETGKDTLFYYGGLRYDKSRVASSASRSKKADGNADAMSKSVLVL